LHDPGSAAAELQQALTLNPGYTPALLNLANLYEDAGKRPEASSLYARILSIEPGAHEALARFANLQRAAEVDTTLIDRLRGAVADAIAMSDKASLGFSLGRLLDAKGRYREAFAAYTAANKASLASAGPHVVPYDSARQTAFVDHLIAGGTPPVCAHISDARRCQASKVPRSAIAGRTLRRAIIAHVCLRHAADQQRARGRSPTPCFGRRHV